jgi:hypothetical protein
MKNRTIRIIAILVCLLFINIEAAQAGLILKLKLFIRHEFADYRLEYISLILLLTSALAYIIFSPVAIGSEKWAWYNYFTYNPGRNNYSNKKDVVKKISVILNQKRDGSPLHS